MSLPAHGIPVAGRELCWHRSIAHCTSRTPATGYGESFRVILKRVDVL